MRAMWSNSTLREATNWLLQQILSNEILEFTFLLNFGFCFHTFVITSSVSFQWTVENKCLLISKYFMLKLKKNPNKQRGNSSLIFCFPFFLKAVMLDKKTKISASESFTTSFLSFEIRHFRISELLWLIW